MIKKLISQCEEGWSWVGAGTCHLRAASGCAISIPCDFSVYFYHSHPQSGRGDGGSYCAMKSGRRKWSWVLSWLCPDDV